MRVHQTATNGKQTRLYRVWANIIQRCENPNNKRFKDYGARGITICNEWRHNFWAFEQWAYANGYDENAKNRQCTLDRIENDKGYSPDNCRFVNNYTQCNNKRNNIKIKIGEITHTIQEWSRIVGIPDYVIRDRINKLHWSPVEAVITPKLPVGIRR